MTTKICLLTILALAAAGIGCSTANQAAYDNANTAQTAQATTSPAPDNSEITTSVDAQGNRTETRTFRDNPHVSKVVVTTNKNGTKTTRVVSRNGEEREVKTDENVLEATGDKVASAAGFVADKGEDVAGEAKDKTVAGAKEVGDKAEDVKDKTVSTTKKVGSTVADKSEDVAGKTVSTTKKVGSTVADKTEDAAGKTVSTTKKAGKKVGSAVKKVIP